MPTKTNDSRRLKAYGPRPAPTDAPTTDRAVSPVIGVVMLVAVTVLMASAVAIAGLPFTDNVGDSTPNVDLSLTKAASGDVVLTHTGGERLDTDRLGVTVDGGAVTATYSDAALTAGGTITVASEDVSPGQTVTVIFTLDSGETRVLYRAEAP